MVKNLTQNIKNVIIVQKGKNMDKVVSIGSKRNASKNSKEKREAKGTVKKPDIKKIEPVYCSFCGRPNTQVPKMVKGPGVNICSECTLIAVQYLILQDGVLSGEAQKIIDMLWDTNPNGKQ